MALGKPSGEKKYIKVTYNLCIILRLISFQNIWRNLHILNSNKVGVYYFPTANFDLNAIDVVILVMN